MSYCDCDFNTHECRLFDWYFLWRKILLYNDKNKTGHQLAEALYYLALFPLKLVQITTTRIQYMLIVNVVVQLYAWLGPIHSKKVKDQDPDQSIRIIPNLFRGKGNRNPGFLHTV